MKPTSNFAYPVIRAPITFLWEYRHLCPGAFLGFELNGGGGGGAVAKLHMTSPTHCLLDKLVSCNLFSVLV